MYEMDRIRVELFRQLKDEIRGSKEHLIVGIDVAKEKHNAFFGTATGKTLLKRLVFGNTMEGFNKLLSFVEAVKVKHGLSSEVFGLEPCVFQSKPATHSIASRPLIPFQASHPFQSNPAGDSRASRPPCYEA